jgi:hypothetical protein
MQVWELVRRANVKLSWVMILLQLMCCVYTSTAAEHQPDAVVRKLYSQVVSRHPLGIPKGSDRRAIWPFLSKQLTQKLEAAQACEADYTRQHAGGDGKPEFGWLESGLFSGENEEALPVKAVIERTKPQQDGSFQVYVKLEYRNSESPDPANTFHWQIAAKVISEGGRFVVDDVLQFKDDSTQVESRLSNSFAGCQGSRWIGQQAKAK